MKKIKITLAFLFIFATAVIINGIEPPIYKASVEPPIYNQVADVTIIDGIEPPIY